MPFMHRDASRGRFTGTLHGDASPGRFKETLHLPWRASRFIFIGFLITALLPFAAWANSRTGYLLADDKGKILVSQNLDEQLIPASTFKLLTALGAFHELGEDFRFKTEFFIAPGHILKIKGYGDPFLTSEVIEKLCSDLAIILKKNGVLAIEGIEIDNSFFDPSIEIPGSGNSTNPYDAAVNAISANFNTVSFKFSRNENRYVSAEPQTPLLPFTKDKILASRLDQGRIVLSRNESSTYGGRLVSFFLEKEKIKVKGDVREGKITAKDKKIHTHISPYTLKELVQNLLKYSNNFIANQIFLSVGARRYSPPATLEKGVTALRIYANEILRIPGVKIAEGSGLSRKNRISPGEMLKVLMAFKEHFKLMNHEENEFYKTGTLNGIRTRVGYFTDKNQRLFPYVIMVNQDGEDYGRIKNKLKAMVK